MRIFVGYRKADRALVHELVQDLVDMGHDLDFNREFDAGEEWWQGVLQKIRDCELFVFALTPASLESYSCTLEYTYANSLNKNILVVSLSPGWDLDELPIILQERPIVQYVEPDKDAFKSLSGAIQDMPDAKALPDPLPTTPDMPISPLRAVRNQINESSLNLEQQISILNQLKGFLTNPDHVGEARELLERLSEHPTLYATVLREILATLATAPSVRSISISSLEIPALEGDEEDDGEPKALPEKENEDSAGDAQESVIAKYAGKLVESTFGAKDGTWGLTQRQLVFKPDDPTDSPVRIILEQIQSMKTGRKLFKKVVLLTMKSGETYAIALNDFDHDQFIVQLQGIQAPVITNVEEVSNDEVIVEEGDE